MEAFLALLSTLGVSSIIIGLIEVLKTAGLPVRFAPLASVALGVGLAALALVSGLVALNPFVVLCAGLVLGLTACGLYSGSKTTAGK